MYPRASFTADRDISLFVQAELLRVDIDLHELCFARKEPGTAHRKPVVDAFADDEKEVGFGECAYGGAVQRRVGVAHAERVIVGDYAARHRDGIEGQLPSFDEGV